MQQEQLDNAWQQLAAHAEEMRGRHLRELFAEDPQRFTRFSLSDGDLLLDFSKQRIGTQTLHLLCNLAQAADPGSAARCIAQSGFLTPAG
jgi:glucose-6-phosphate isomerase